MVGDVCLTAIRKQATNEYSSGLSIVFSSAQKIRTIFYSQVGLFYLPLPSETKFDHTKTVPSASSYYRTLSNYYESERQPTVNTVPSIVLVKFSKKVRLLTDHIYR